MRCCKSVDAIADLVSAYEDKSQTRGAQWKYSEIFVLKHIYVLVKLIDAHHSVRVCSGFFKVKSENVDVGRKAPHQFVPDKFLPNLL